MYAGPTLDKKPALRGAEEEKGLSKFSSSKPQKEGRVMNVDIQNRAANCVPTAPNPMSCGRLSLILALLAWGAMNLWGQGTAYITGFVTDPTQAAVPGAGVVIKSDETGSRYDAGQVHCQRHGARF